MSINIEKLGLSLQKEIEEYKNKSDVSSVYRIPRKSKVSHKYSVALFEMAKEIEKIKEVEEDLKIFYSTIFANKETFSFFSDPFKERSVKLKIVEHTYSGNVLEQSLNFLCILIQKNSIHLLSNILEDYRSERNQFYNIAQVYVRSALPITDKRQIIEAATKLAGREVDVDITVEPELIGGITVEIDGIVYDYSVRMALDDMKKKLLNVEIDNSEIT